MVFPKFQVLLSIASFISVVFSYPSSVPNDSQTCMSMTPGHNRPGQQTPSPFFISLSNNAIRCGDVMEITLSGQESFKGFFLQARGPGDVQLGEFFSGPTHSVNSCPNGQNNVAHHHNKDLKNHIKILWRAPLNFVGGVTFTCTFVQDFSIFWVKQTAPQMVQVFN